MPERKTIQSSGFANTGPADARTGFQVMLRQPNYRSLRLSLVEGIDITVDGQTFPAAGNRVLLEGVEYSHAEMAETTQVRWKVGQCLTVLVPLAGGLAPGVHEVASLLHLRHPYFPPRFQPISVPDQRHATIIVQ